MTWVIAAGGHASWTPPSTARSTGQRWPRRAERASPTQGGVGSPSGSRRPSRHDPVMVGPPASAEGTARRACRFRARAERRRLAASRRSRPPARQRGHHAGQGRADHQAQLVRQAERRVPRDPLPAGPMSAIALLAGHAPRAEQRRHAARGDVTGGVEPPVAPGRRQAEGHGPQRGVHEYRRAPPRPPSRAAGPPRRPLPAASRPPPPRRPRPRVSAGASFSASQAIATALIPSPARKRPRPAGSAGTPGG